MEVATMITVTRLNGSRVTVNALLIEMIEETPNTVISLTTGNKIVVQEDVVTVINHIQAYLGKIGFVQGVQAIVKSQDTEG